MPPKNRPPSRPPARVKSSLPAPRVAPRRVHTPWRQRRAIQVLLGIVVLGIAALVVWRGLDFWHHHNTTLHTKAAVKTYDGMLQSALSPLGTFLSQAVNTPPGFLSGGVSETAYISQTAQWTATVQTLRSQLTSASTPAVLQKAKAELIQGADLMIDAVNQFQLAGTTKDPAERLTLIQDATNTLAHAEAVLSDGAQEEAQTVVAYGLPLPSGETPASLKVPPEAPPVTATVTPQPSPT
jgi:hypothetical protein